MLLLAGRAVKREPGRATAGGNSSRRVKRAAGSPASLPAGSFLPHTASSRSAAVPVSGAPEPRVQSRSQARNSTPARSVPKYATDFSVVLAGRTRRSRSGGTGWTMPSGTVMSRPWIRSWASAPSNPPPGGRHGWLTLARIAAVSSAGDIRAASRRATRSAISLNLPRDLASSSMNRRPLYRNGIVMCATTSRTRQPAQSVGSSQPLAGSSFSTVASSPRWAAIMSLMVSIAVTSPW